MKLSNMYFFTKREDAKDEESASANLLVRAGMIKKFLVVFIVFCH